MCHCPGQHYLCADPTACQLHIRPASMHCIHWLLAVIQCWCFLDIPDRELNCVGYWLEDMKSYMITYDMEDAISTFRCWVCLITYYTHVNLLTECAVADLEI